MIWWKLRTERGWKMHRARSGTVRTCLRHFGLGLQKARARWNLNMNVAYLGVPRWKVEKCARVLLLDSTFLRLCAGCVPCAKSLFLCQGQQLGHNFP